MRLRGSSNGRTTEGLAYLRLYGPSERIVQVFISWKFGKICSERFVKKIILSSELIVFGCNFSIFRCQVWLCLANLIEW